MLSTPSFHPFFSHFPIALSVAGLIMMWLARKRSEPDLVHAASLNFSAALLMGILAVFTGLFAADIGMLSTVKVEGHQGYSFAFVVVLVICTVFAYTRALSKTAFVFYILNVLIMGATAWSGYVLVFQSGS